jgi:hypothetical protein
VSEEDWENDRGVKTQFKCKLIIDIRGDLTAAYWFLGRLSQAEEDTTHGMKAQKARVGE